VTTYAWPTTSLFEPSSATLRQFHNNRVSESPQSGYTQTNSTPGARWGWVFDLNPHLTDDRATVEGFFTKLNGREHRVQVWDMKRPTPRGTLTSATVSSAVQFAASLTLTSATGYDNKFLRPQEFDNSSWTKAGVTVNANAYAAPDGTTTAEELVENTANTVHSLTQTVTITAGATLAVSIHVKRGVGSRHMRIDVHSDAGANLFRCQVNLSTGVLHNTQAVGTATIVSASVEAVSNGFLRVVVVGRVAPAATSVNTVFYSLAALDASSIYTGDGASSMVWWGAQFAQASAAYPYAAGATLKAGDWVGLPNGQLVMAVADAMADGSRNLTFEFRHPLRAALSSGGAVTLIKPTALYILASSSLDMPRQGGMSEPPVTFEFIEVFS
jgi:hypothetical protein